jgi:translation elongation factor P/translation initiation factor 5A
VADPRLPPHQDGPRLQPRSNCIKLRNVKKGHGREVVPAGERWPRAQIDRAPGPSLPYRDDDDLHLMETESYEQFSLRAETLEASSASSKEG